MTICAVDDEQGALQNVINAIREACPDAVLHGFGNPDELLRFLERGERLDVAFLDIRMRSMSGIALAKRVKEMQSAVNIIFVTGFSEYMPQAFALHASGYILKPASGDAVREELENLRHPVNISAHKALYVQCFGNFEVFYNGSALLFARSKSKELLAYLVHRNGSSCTTREIAAILYEDREYSSSIRSQVQTIISSLAKTLRSVGLCDVLIRKYNSLAIDPKAFDCDYYRFLECDAAAVNSYMGEYMVQYAWAEFTLGYLDSKIFQ